MHAEADRVTRHLLGHENVMKGDENALLESSGIALLCNLILSIYTLDFILP